MIKSESMRWERDVAHVGETLNAYKIWLQIVRCFYLKEVGMYGRIILKLILKKLWKGVEWNHLAQYQAVDQGQAPMTVVLNFLVL